MLESKVSGKYPIARLIPKDWVLFIEPIVSGIKNKATPGVARIPKVSSA